MEIMYPETKAKPLMLEYDDLDWSRLKWRMELNSGSKRGMAKRWLLVLSQREFELDAPYFAIHPLP